MGWLEDLRISRRAVFRALVLVSAALLCAALAMDWTRAPTLDLAVGDVAPRTVTAPFDFRYQDVDERRARQQEAREAVAPVFTVDVGLLPRLQDRIDAAFEAGRTSLPSPDEDGVSAPLSPEDVDAITAAFRDDLGVHLPREIVAPLVEAGFPEDAARLARELLAQGMDGYVIGDRAVFGGDANRFTVIERGEDGVTEREVVGMDRVRTPFEARQRVSLALLDSGADAPWAEAAATVARALVQANMAYDADETERRRDRAAAAVPVRTITVKRGTTLFRQGDPITDIHVRQLTEMRKTRSGGERGMQWLGLSGFLLALFGSLYAFGASSLRGFSTRVRDVAAVGLLLVITAAIAKVIAGLAPSAATVLGAGAGPEHLVWLVPTAGATILVRLLIGVRWAMVFAVAAAVVSALVVGGGILEVGYFVVTSMVAAGAVDHTRERMAVLRAGVYTGLVGAVLALLLFFASRALLHGPSADPQLAPLFAMLSGFGSGVLSAFLVLGLTPLFETAGFVTDYRLMELASLNHPLLRQLMLRAPGSYHHSVVVGSLAEAACNEIGANALMARVASYFHDIGKSLKPQYFVENQGSGGNRHDKLDPYTSAEVIIGHVVEGARLAREHGLPKPILDNILMHHGTGLLPYFYRKALDQADDPADVDERAFRYPGPKPNNREAGVIMLADKVEAATRTIKQPTEENFRAMIAKIVDSVMADGQFEECPLTFAEIHVITNSFVKTLLGIYHHRIEYPDTADISKQGTDEARREVIPLEFARRGGRSADDLPDDPNTDYESIEHLPR